MIVRAQVAAGLLSAAVLERLLQVCQKYGLPISCPARWEDLFEICRQDKKNTAKDIRVILLRDIGDSYIQKFNKEVLTLPYILGTSSKLKKEVYFQQDWIKMIQDHTVNILGWIQYEKVKWLQNNNPEVPGLVYKLTPTEEKVRKLKKVRDLWQDIMEVQEIRDVFTGQPMEGKYDIDHFIPWSFVMNDELWNLMPMDASLNSSKSNRLPKWNPFFQNFDTKFNI